MARQRQKTNPFLLLSIVIIYLNQTLDFSPIISFLSYFLQIFIVLSLSLSKVLDFVLEA